MIRMIGISMLLTMSIGHQSAWAATTLKHYYAHDAVEDEHGVIAPWYKGQNGQCDARVRISAETLKRYPWSDPQKAAKRLPEYIYSGHWNISDDGTITIPTFTDWNNGDYGQRAAYTLAGLIEYYRYTGDATALAHINLYADALLEFALTPEDHPWPKFLISVPVRGKSYGQADPRGFIQLEIVSEVGVMLIRAAQITGNERWMEAARHWGDLIAENRLSEPGLPPWSRYANPQDVLWEDRLTGGVVYHLEFFDELIRAGYTGRGNAIPAAREAAMSYLRDVLLPNWTGYDTWGRNYWDWPCPTRNENVTTFVARYMMNHPDEFPNWRCDIRNILGLFLNCSSVWVGSGSDTFSGAWAYPESFNCCRRSLVYAPQEVATAFAQYGVLADSEWGRELARRQIILATYDFHENGVVEDVIDGGADVDKVWFKIAHPMPLRNILLGMAWLPELFGAARENHLMRTNSVVTNVIYDDGSVRFDVHDAPVGTRTVARLAFRPTEIEADGKPLKLADENQGNGYQIKELANGDFLVTIRHDGLTSVTIKGDDPQERIPVRDVQTSGFWRDREGPTNSGPLWLSGEKGASLTCRFIGNQVRLLGDYAPDGGLAEVYIDGVRQMVGIDCWNPTPRSRQLLYYKNGLSNGPHELKVVAQGVGNPVSQGANLYVSRVLCSAATGDNGFGSGGGPRDTQRMIMGYPSRTDYTDSQGQAWRPGTEFVIRAGGEVDSVAASWYTEPRQTLIMGTSDPELYRHGVHGKDFWVNVTVGPGTYYVRLKFMENQAELPWTRSVTVFINDQEMVKHMDVPETAALAINENRPNELLRKKFIHYRGLGRPVELVFNGIKPVNGIICIRFRGELGGQAAIQAIEVGPGDGGQGARPVFIPEAQPVNVQQKR